MVDRLVDLSSLGFAGVVLTRVSSDVDLRLSTGHGYEVVEQVESYARRESVLQMDCLSNVEVTNEPRPGAYKKMWGLCDDVKVELDLPSESLKCRARCFFRLFAYMQFESLISRLRRGRGVSKRLYVVVLETWSNNRRQESQKAGGLAERFSRRI